MIKIKGDVSGNGQHGLPQKETFPVMDNMNYLDSFLAEKGHVCSKLVLII